MAFDLQLSVADAAGNVWAQVNELRGGRRVKTRYNFFSTITEMCEIFAGSEAQT
jgi:hypothetical protein